MRNVFKKTSVVGLLLVLALFSGCTLFEKQAVIPEATEEEKQLDKRTGTIQVLLDAQTRAVSHVLQSESGEFIKLVSVGVQLDRYVGRKVQVEGIYEERENTINVELITTLSEELGIKKNYVNGSMGVSFSYPANWSLDESQVSQEGVIRIYPFAVPQSERSTIDSVTIARLDNAQRTSVRDWLKLDELFRPTQQNDTQSLSYQESIIGKQQYQSVKTVMAAPYQVAFFVQREVHMYQISFDSRQAEEKNTNENAFFELISSFDFVPFTDATIGTVTAPQLTVSTSTNTLPSLLPPPSQYADNTFLTPYEKALTSNTDAFKGTVSKFEFVIKDENSPPSGVYVTYTDGTEAKRTLGEYSDPKNPETFVEKATFTLGPVGNWVLASGVDTAKGMQKVVVNPTTSTVTVLATGMQLIESRLFKARFQVPAKWYWSITPDGYALDTKPLQAGKDPMLVMSTEAGFTDGSTVNTPAGKSALLGMVGEKTALCLPFPKKNFCLLYTDQTLDQNVLLTILDSIIEN